MIQLRHLRNLLQHQEVSSPRAVEWGGQAIRDLAPAGATAAIVNDLLTLPEDWDARVADGSTITFLNVPGGGDFGDAVELINLIANPGEALGVAFFKDITGNDDTGRIYGNIKGSIESAFNQVGGLFAGAGALGAGARSGESSSTYSFGQISTSGQYGAAIPVVYGEHAVGGKIAQAWTESLSDESYLNLLLLLSRGPIEAIGQYTSSATTETYTKSLLAAEAFAAGAWPIINRPIGAVNISEASGLTNAQLLLEVKASSLTAAAGRNLVVELGSDAALDDRELQWGVTSDLGALLPAANEWFPLALDFTAAVPQGPSPIDFASIVRVRVFTSSGAAFTLSVRNVRVSVTRSNLYGQDGLTGEALPEGMQINGQDANTLDGVSVSLRYGKPGQTVMPGFEEIRTQYGQTYVLKYWDAATGTGGPRFVWRGRDATNGFDIQVAFDRGLFRVRKGEMRSVSVVLRVEVWTYDPVTGLIGSLEHSETWTHTEARRDQLTRSLRVRPNGGERAFYELRVWRETPDTPDSNLDRADLCTLVAVTDVISAGVAYEGLAMLGLRIRASEQVSGGIPTVSTLMKGRRIQIWNGSAWVEQFSRNPFWIAVDALTDRTYGKGADVARDMISRHIGEWVEAANFADELVPRYTGSVETEPRYQFDGVFDVQTTAWDAALRILETARAIPMRVGRSIRPAVLRPKAVSQVFGMGRIHLDSYKFAYKDTTEAANHYQVTFADRTKRFESNTVQEFLEVVNPSTEPLVQRQVSLFGVTRETQARRAAAYMLRAERLSGGISFTAGMVACGVLPLDVIGISTDLPYFAESGLLVGGTGSTVALDQVLDFKGERVYTYCEVNPATDALLRRDFSFDVDTSTDVLPFAPLHGSNGAAGRQWTLGPKGEELEEILVTSVARNNDHTFTIEGVEYVPDVYSDDASAPENGIVQPPPVDPPGYAAGVSLSESWQEADVSSIQVSWAAVAGAVRYRVVLVAGGVSSEVGSTTATGYRFPCRLERSTLITVVVIAIDLYGVGVSAANALSQPEGTGWRSLRLERDDTGQTVASPPGNVAVSSVVTSGSGYTITWAAVDGAEEYEARLGSWSGGVRLYRGAATSFSGRGNARPQPIYIRARRGGLWSPLCAVTSWGSALPAGWTNQVLLNTNDLPEVGQDDGLRLAEWVSPTWEGRIENADVIPYDRSRFALLQRDTARRMVFTGRVFDTGSSAASFVSVVFGTRAFSSVAADSGFPGSADSLAPTGPIAGDSALAAKIILLFSDAVYTSSGGETFLQSPTTVDLTDRIGREDVFVTARYFQVSVELEAVELPGESDRRRACLTILAYAVHRQ